MVAATTGVVFARLTVGTDPDGYEALVELADQYGLLRAWAMEGSRGYGTEMTAYLAERDELIVEVEARSRPPGVSVDTLTSRARDVRVISLDGKHGHRHLHSSRTVRLPVQRAEKGCR